MNYATLAQAKQYMNLEEANDDDALLEIFLAWSTGLIENHKNRWYEPRIQTRVYDLPTLGRGSLFGVFDPSLLPAAPQPPLRLDADLLELTELLNGDGEEITDDDYVLEKANTWPKTRIVLIDGATWQASTSGKDRQVIQLTGVWGTHDNYTNAWTNSGQAVQNNPLGIGDTTLSVTSGAAFQVGQLLRANLEYLLVTAISNNDLTISRGVNGSTAAQHAQNTAIHTWQVQSNIAQACLRLVKWRYTQKDTDNFDRTYYGDTGVVSVPTAMPVDVMALLGARKVSPL